MPPDLEDRPPVTAHEVMNRLRREGSAEHAGKGSHAVFVTGGRMVVVPNHRSDLKTGTLQAICRDAGWEWPIGRTE
jgi:predicted RNA binding protein YcfA (HicA-like mRNA interferase family)